MVTSSRPGRDRTRPALRHRLAPHRDLVSGSLWVVISVGIHAVSGFAFWLVAARLGDTDSVGRATALFTASLFVSYATSLGLPVALARFAPDSGSASNDLFVHSARLSWAASTMGALAMIAAVPASVRAPLGEIGMPIGIALFALVTGGVSLATLVDVRWMTLRSWRLVAWRVSLLGLVRIALVPLGRSPLWLFVLVAGAVALSGYIGVALLVGRNLLRRIPRPDQLRPLVRYATVHYLGSVAIQGPTFAVPLIVLLIVTSTDNAVFYVVWGIGANLNLIPHVIGQAFLAEGAKDGRAVAAQTWVALGLALGLMVVGTGALVIGRDLVASLYGEGYERVASLVVRLAAASIPWSITAIALARARVEDRSGLSTLLTTCYAAGTVGMTVLLTRDGGIHGAANAWLVANSAVALVAIGVLWQLHRHPRSAPAPIERDPGALSTGTTIPSSA